jgi:hypothetical protein
MAVAAEEAINLYVETLESQAPIAPGKEYGGSSAETKKSLYGTPGMNVFSALPESPVRGQCWTGTRLFAVAGTKLCEVMTDGTFATRSTVANDSGAVSIAVSNVQLLIISAGKAYCYTLATNTLLEVTPSLAAVPMQADYSDGYFVVCFKNSNKFQMSAILDGTTWPGVQVNAVSVFPENITSIIVNHRELWVFGSEHCQPYQDTGSLEVFDVIPGALIEKGCAATFAPCKADNTVLWIDEDERGGRSAWRAQGYTPQRISTHAVEADLQSYASISGLVSYSYQENGHLFWVLYIPGAQWSWVYDISEGLWHKRQSGWNGIVGQAHWSWNHTYAFGRHLVGDWNSANLYEMNLAFLTDNGSTIRRVRRAPTVINEMEWIRHSELTVDFEPGVGPEIPLIDGNGNPRSPQAILRWSDDRGNTWSNEHWSDVGYAGQYRVRAIWRRLGRSRYRVYELTLTDPVSWAIVDAYLKTA